MNNSCNLLEATSPDINATVSASAGTGKTWLLVARLLRLLLAGETPASILAITFTQKSAAEIRERLTITLREWAQIDDVDLTEELTRIGAKPTQIKRARELYETLIYSENDIRILTFHAFCTEILERFPFEAKIPPGFEICSEGDELREEALNRLYIEAATKNSASNVAQALQILFETCNGLSNTNLALNNFLNHRNDWLAYTQGADEPVKNAIQALSEMLDIKLEDLEKPIKIDQKTYEMLAKHAEFILLHKNTTNEKYAQVINAFLQSNQEINDETLPPLAQCFFTQKGEPRKLFKAFTNSLGINAFNQFSINLKELTNVLLEITNALLKRQTFRRNKAWYIAGQRFVEIYHDLKISRRQLDFNDLEWLACHLVNHEDNAQWIQYRLNERINHILVDEFQDTNPQQWQLLKPLFEEMASQKSGGSAFIVGDTKQSIYGFRRANPELQHQAQQWLAQHMNGQLYTTDTSRRSSPKITAFINRVFNNDSPLQELPDFRPHNTALDTPGGVIIMQFAEKNQMHDGKTKAWRQILRDPPTFDIDHPAHKEGEQIAFHITQMVKDQVAIYDRNGNARPLRFSDVALLLRRRTHLDYYERALMQSDIPYSSGRIEKVFSSLEIADMLALLSFLVNYKRNLDLAQVLRSPIFAVSDDQLIALSKTQGDCWFTRLGHIKNDDVLRSAHELISGWIETARTRLPIHDLLDHIYHEGDVIHRYRLAASAGEESLVEKNLLDFLDYSLEFESGRYPDIAHFTSHLKRHMQRIKKNNSAKSSNIESDTLDQVRILTIHQAKGLEAPVIILADCGQQKKRHDTYNILADWPPQGNRPKHFLLIPKSGDMDNFTKECKRKLESRDAREETNLLYVALTRARQYLFVSGHGTKPKDGWYGLLKTCATESPPKWETVATRTDELTSEIIDKTTATDTASELVSQTTLPRRPMPTPHRLEISPSTLVNLRPSPQSSDELDSANNSDQKLRGQIIHYALKLLTEKVKEEDVRNMIKNHFPRSTKNLNACIKSAQTLIADESLHALFDDTRYEQVLNEIPISFIHEGDQYVGIIDRICVNDDMIWLIDYKTHKSPSDRAQEIKAYYTEQMRMYYLGVSKLWPGRKIRVSLLLTETRQLCDYNFDE